MSKEASTDLEEWKCPPCRGNVVDASSLLVDDFHNKFDCSDDSDDEDSTSQATDVEKLWPPYGLLGSEKASEALGIAACVVPSMYEIRAPVVPSQVAPSPVPVLRQIHGWNHSSGSAGPLSLPQPMPAQALTSNPCQPSTSSAVHHAFSSPFYGDAGMAANELPISPHYGLPTVSFASRTLIEQQAQCFHSPAAILQDYIISHSTSASCSGQPLSLYPSHGAQPPTNGS
jgi:hypothetical protein